MPALESSFEAKKQAVKAMIEAGSKLSSPQQRLVHAVDIFIKAVDKAMLDTISNPASFILQTYKCFEETGMVEQPKRTVCACFCYGQKGTIQHQASIYIYTSIHAPYVHTACFGTPAKDHPRCRNARSPRSRRRSSTPRHQTQARSVQRCLPSPDHLVRRAAAPCHHRALPSCRCSHTEHTTHVANHLYFKSHAHLHPPHQPFAKKSAAVGGVPQYHLQNSRRWVDCTAGQHRIGSVPTAADKTRAGAVTRLMQHTLYNTMYVGTVKAPSKSSTRSLLVQKLAANTATARHTHTHTRI